MLCCVGLIGGVAVGQYLGGPWMYIAPTAGFGIGLVGDLKFMKARHRKAVARDEAPRAKKDTGLVVEMEAGESKLSRGVASAGAKDPA